MMHKKAVLQGALEAAFTALKVCEELAALAHDDQAREDIQEVFLILDKHRDARVYVALEAADQKGV